MNDDKKRKRRLMKLIGAQVVMVVAALVTMVFFVFWAMGYKLNKEWQLEQNGLIHVVSSPSGAEVSVDGQRNFMRSGISKMASAGVHRVRVEKNGFMAWEKDVSVRAGFSTQLFYVRLMPVRKQIEVVRKMREPVVWSVAPNREKILYADGAEWRLINLRNPGEGGDVKLDFGAVMRGVLGEERGENGGSGGSEKAQGGEAAVGAEVERGGRRAGAEVERAEIERMEWSKNSNNILVKLRKGERREWVLLNLRNPGESVNISERMAVVIDDLKIMNGAADRLWMLEKGNLREIRVRDLVMSQVLVAGVESFYNDEDVVSFVGRAESKDGEEAKRTGRFVGVYKEGDRESARVMEVPETGEILTANLGYYGEEYLVVTVGEEMRVMVGQMPVGERENRLMERKRVRLSEVPQEILVSNNAQLVMMERGERKAVFDLENEQVYNFGLKVGGFVDDVLLWGWQGGEIFVQDFDGTNRRMVGEGEGMAAAVSQDGRWLYYVRRGEGLELVRLELLL